MRHKGAHYLQMTSPFSSSSLAPGISVEMKELGVHDQEGLDRLERLCLLPRI